MPPNHGGAPSRKGILGRYAVSFFIGICACHIYMAPAYTAKKPVVEPPPPPPPPPPPREDPCPPVSPPPHPAPKSRPPRAPPNGKGALTDEEMLAGAARDHLRRFEGVREGDTVVSSWPSCVCQSDLEVPVTKLSEEQVADRLKSISDRAVECKAKVKAEGVSDSIKSGIALARCARSWLSTKPEELKPNSSKIVVDYMYDGSENPMPWVTGTDWVYLTPVFPEPGQPLPSSLKPAPNQIVMAPPTPYRMRSMLVTNSIFNLNLIFRMDELVDIMGETFLQLLGRLISMARVSYIFLPCKLEDYDPELNRLSSEDVLLKAARAAMAKSQGGLGVRFIDFRVKAVAVFRHGSCTRELLKLTAVKIHRGVRLKWCYYPLGTKYDLIYRRGEYMQLVHRLVQQWTKASGDKMKTIRKWKPSINLADILGWGVTNQQREVMFWDVLTQPSCPDAAVQNWLLTEEGRILRIDNNQQAIKGQHPEARMYVEFMKIFLCMHKGVEWKQVFGMTPQGLELGLHHLSRDNLWRFLGNRMYRREKADQEFEMVKYPNATDINEYPKCPDCNLCVMHSWRPLKFVWHNKVSLPPPACHACYKCQKEQQLKGGVDLSTANGCNDVEGVGRDSVETEDFCFETQKKPLPRPSATKSALKKGPY